MNLRIEKCFARILHSVLIFMQRCSRAYNLVFIYLAFVIFHAVIQFFFYISIFSVDVCRYPRLNLINFVSVHAIIFKSSLQFVKGFKDYKYLTGCSFCLIFDRM